MYQPFDIVRVPFPFADLSQSKIRPAVILSGGEFNQSSHLVVTAMITSAKHSDFPLDVTLKHWQIAGLPCACLARMKLFTIEQSKIQKKVGALHLEDRQNLIHSLKALLPYTSQ